MTTPSYLPQRTLPAVSNAITVAPAIPKMAPVKRQTTIRGFGKVSKLAASVFDVKAAAKQALAPPGQTCSATKRKRDDSEDEEPSQLQDLAFDKIFSKKPKLQLPSPPSLLSSSKNVSLTIPQSPSSAIKKLSLLQFQPSSTKLITAVEDLPQSLRDILSLHECLLKALAIHYAHNGPSAPAELTSLCGTVTCLWKKRRVTKEDLQCVLALYEIVAESNATITATNTIAHKNAPFKLKTASTQTCIEYIGSGSTKTYRGGLMRSPFNEKCLQGIFKAGVMSLYITAQVDSDSKLAFLDGPASLFPLLACEIGQQTVQRRAKASSARAEILDVAVKSQLRQNTKPSLQPVEDREEQTGAQVSEKIKSRTQSLFDRVKAKQLANASSGAPTQEIILRRHAIGRIAEVVEILRMKQQQKLSGSFMSSLHDSPGKVRASKVSFSFGQIANEIKNSASVPIGQEEVRMCLQMLSKEVDGCWLTVVEVGNVKSVILQGQGMNGRETQKELEEKEKARA